MNWLRTAGMGMAALFAGCSETVDVFAPEEDIWVVYGVLDPDAPAQDIRISKVFQVEADAYAYAATRDFSAAGLRVYLEGGGSQYEARWVDSVRKDSAGDFGLYAGVYRFDTPAGARLRYGERYTLTIVSDSGLQLSSQARIPPRPVIVFPAVQTSGGDRCLPGAAFEDSVYVMFDADRDDLGVRAMRYEARVRLAYYADGRPQQVLYRTRRLFDRTTGCAQSGGSGWLCYLYPAGQVLNGLRLQMEQTPAQLLQYDAQPRCGNLSASLSDAVQLQILAIDTSLARYLLANDPRQTDFTTIRTEYTNISGNARAVGVFGAVSSDRMPVSLSPCSEYRLGLRREAPPGCL
ncbi:MAG: DUF4249 family protein [Bacteroidia bacterium]|nr:DUF4249 family protein [Bacteroidia bacterium]